MSMVESRNYSQLLELKYKGEILNLFLFMDNIIIRPNCAFEFFLPHGLYRTCFLIFSTFIVPYFVWYEKLRNKASIR